MKQYYVYIMTNKSRTLYTGVTNDLIRRVYEHKHQLIPGFCSKYQISQLVYFEVTQDVFAALNREKQIKGWLRSKKIQLIESVNPDWQDLSIKVQIIDSSSAKKQQTQNDKTSFSLLSLDNYGDH